MELMPESLIFAILGVAILRSVQLLSSEVFNDGVKDRGMNGSGWNVDLL
jgi:hypothetical protein